MYESVLETEIGFIIIKADDYYINEVSLCKDRPSLAKEENKLTVLCKKYLEEYFLGVRKEFNLPVNFTGTEFQRSVWRELMKVPFGETRSYGEIACAIGRPKAVRAVGGACSKNPILIIVPCHRIVGATGKLTGFACGVPVKQWLLNLEGN